MMKVIFIMLGTGIETNVSELYRLLNEIAGNGQEEKHGPQQQQANR